MKKKDPSLDTAFFEVEKMSFFCIFFGGVLGGVIITDEKQCHNAILDRPDMRNSCRWMVGVWRGQVWVVSQTVAFANSSSAATVVVALHSSLATRKMEKRLPPALWSV